MYFLESFSVCFLHVSSFYFIFWFFILEKEVNSENNREMGYGILNSFIELIVT
jgi:hypothetical protein